MQIKYDLKYSHNILKCSLNICLNLLDLKKISFSKGN